jgi:transposase
MGRSRGGLTTKIHAVVDADGRPIRLALTAGQAHDGRMAEPMLQDISKGAILLADKAYDTNACENSQSKSRPGQMFPPRPVARAASPSAHGSIDSAIWSSVSSANSNSSEASPPAMTKTR